MRSANEKELVFEQMTAEEPELISKEEAKQLREIMGRFIAAYKAKEPGASDREWLAECYHKELPDWSNEKIEKLTEDTLSTIAEYDRNLADAESAAKQGISSEKWLSSRIMDAGKGVAINEFGNRLAEIDVALTNGNAQMLRTVTTKAGNVSLCPNLDGFIAEQHHVNTYNANAALKNSDFVAQVKVPGPGETYGKNSFDLVIKNKITGKTVQQYQAKFGADAQATIKLLKSGNYNNQRFLVPAEQLEEVQAAFPGKTVTSVIGGPELDGVTSNPLTKQQAKALQDGTQQQGNIPTVDYNSFQTKELALHIGQNAGMAGLQAAALAGGLTLIAGAVNGESVDSDAVIETALATGADTGIKAAAAGAIKVGAEKGVLAIIPPGTPIHAIANIACIGIENIKILSKVASGELTMKEALDKMGRTSIAMVYGLGWGAAGAGIGAAALSWIPIVGPIVGGLAGGMIGYMAGSKFGETVYNGAKKVASAAKAAVKDAWEGVKSVGRKIGSGVKSVASKFAGFLGL